MALRAADYSYDRGLTTFQGAKASEEDAVWKSKSSDLCESSGTKMCLLPGGPGWV